MSQRTRDALMLVPAVLALAVVTWLSFDRYGPREASPSPSPTAAGPTRSASPVPATDTPAPSSSPSPAGPATVAEVLLQMAGLDLEYYQCRDGWRVMPTRVVQAWEDGSWVTETLIICEGDGDEDAYFTVEHQHDPDDGTDYVRYIGVGP